MTRTQAATSAASSVTGAVIAGHQLPMLDRARIYACGITPYDVTHLGHAATFVWVDALSRTLRFLGVEPELCRNITDVDDVLDAAAQRASAPYDAFAAVRQFHFERDMAALSVRAPQHQPRARRYVEHVIRLASGLHATRAAYHRGLAAAGRAGVDQAEALRLSAEYGGRPDDLAKDDPLDVAVWQAGEPGHPAWESPWGEGRPGWHAECAAMALSVFGVGVDIHAGGKDLRFPHHAYHAAMAEAFTGVSPYARAWLHVGTVTIEGTKMAQSAGYLVLLDDLLAGQTRSGSPVDDPRPLLGRWLGLRSRSARCRGHAAGESVSRRRSHYLSPSGCRGRDSPPPGCCDLNVPAALDLAIEAGGVPARIVATTLGFS